MTSDGIWEVAYDGDGEHEFATVTGAFAYGAEWAAGWMIAVVGMAEAIRARTWKCPTCRCSPSITQSTCFCCADHTFTREDPCDPFV